MSNSNLPSKFQCEYKKKGKKSLKSWTVTNSLLYHCITDYLIKLAKLSHPVNKTTILDKIAAPKFTPYLISRSPQLHCYYLETWNVVPI